MIQIKTLTGSPDAATQQALESFESEFTYPLGPHQRFGISHGADYTLFARSMGGAAVYVAMDGAKVIGALSVVLRQLQRPDGSVQPAAYIADLKVSEEKRGGFALIKLFKRAFDDFNPLCSIAFGVTMDGTTRIPTNYSGRAGMPLFTPVAQIAILKVSGPASQRTYAPTPTNGNARTCTAIATITSAATYRCIAGNSASRSLIAPQIISTHSGGATAILEDTRRAKILMDDHGREMKNLHLTNLSYQSAAQCAELIKRAAATADATGHDGLFVAIPAAHADEVCEGLQNTNHTVAPATVYAHGISPQGNWSINTAEI